MTAPRSQQVIRYLKDADAGERAVARTLQAQIAETPEGPHRDDLRAHLQQARDHSLRVSARVQELDHGIDPWGAVIGAAEHVLRRALALSLTRLDLLRGGDREEKVLDNAKDTCATATLEIARYTALERLAHTAGDEKTARLAASIRADEQTTLEKAMAGIPALTDAVAGTAGEDRATTVAVVRSAPTAAGPRDVQAEPIPWPGYDEQTVEQIGDALSAADRRLACAVRNYERAHKVRAGVIRAAERVASSS